MTDIDRLIDAVEAGTATLSQVQDLCIPIWPNGEDHWKHIAVSFAYDRQDLNAAKRLHDALLPGWGWAVEFDCATVWHPDTKGLSRDWERAADPARAWLLGILKAYRESTL